MMGSTGFTIHPLHPNPKILEAGKGVGGSLKTPEVTGKIGDNLDEGDRHICCDC